MYCLKCGRETEGEQAFCLACQKEMKNYPVDPNAAVRLPVRKQTAVKKSVRRRPSSEEQVNYLKRRLRICACLLAVALIVVVCMAIPLIRGYGKGNFQIGQNYSTVKPGTIPTEGLTAGD